MALAGQGALWGGLAAGGLLLHYPPRANLRACSEPSLISRCFGGLGAGCAPVAALCTGQSASLAEVSVRASRSFGRGWGSAGGLGKPLLSDTPPAAIAAGERSSL